MSAEAASAHSAGRNSMGTRRTPLPDRLGVSTRFTHEVVDTCAGVVIRGPVQCPCDFSIEVRTNGLFPNLFWTVQGTLARDGREEEVLRVLLVTADESIDPPGTYTSKVIYRSIDSTGPVSFRLSLLKQSSVEECKSAFVKVGMEPKPVACRVRNVSPGGKGGAGESTPPTGPATRLLARGGGEEVEHMPFTPVAPVARVVGGRPLRTPDEQSLLAHIFRSGPAVCTGSFLPPHHVITAAHCNVGLGYIVQVFPPRRNRRAPADINMTVATAANHPLYIGDPVSLYDAAVVTVRPTADQAKVIAAANWPRLRLNGDAAVPAAGDAVRAAGYGKVVYEGPASDGALFVDQPVLTPEEAAAYQRDVQEPRRFPEGRDTPLTPKERLDHPAVMCTAVWDGDCSTCQGDSGGPLYQVVPPSRAADRRRPTYVQVGITSYGEGCGRPNTVDVTARVSTVKDWIDWQMRAAPGGTAGVSSVTSSTK